MGSADATISIARPVDVVWAVAGDFGGLGDWMPGIESSRVEGDVRILGILGMEVTEKLVSRDDDAHVIEYSITDSPLQAESHLGRISVVPEGEGSHVTWHVEVTPDSLTDLLAGTYQQALDALKTHVES